MTIVVREKHWTFKLLPEALQLLNITPQGIIHVGAHWGQEVPVYIQCGFDPIMLIEPDPESCEKLYQQSWFDENRITIMPIAIAGGEGTADFHQVRTGSGVWSGLKKNPHRPTADAVFSVRTVPLSAVQELCPANVLVIDTQGTEMDALESASSKGVDLIIIETQVDGVDGAHPAELEQWAVSHGWDIPLVWDRTGGWTDTLLTPGGEGHW